MECLFSSLSMRKVAIKLNTNVLQIKMYHNLEVLTVRTIFLTTASEYRPLWACSTPTHFFARPNKLIVYILKLVTTFSTLFSLHFLWYWREYELFDNQELFKLVIISLILMTFTLDSGVILLGEIRSQSLLGFRGLSLLQ